MSVLDDVLDVGDWIGDYISSPVAWVTGPIGFFGSSGLFGEGFQDFITMGKSAQRRAEEDATDAANKARQKQAELAREQNRRQYIQQIREARIQRARMANRSATEAGISSGAQGALASIGAQLSSNINFMQYRTDTLNKIQEYSNMVNKQTVKAEKYASYYKQAMGVVKLGAQAVGTMVGGPVGGTAAGAAVDAIGGTQTTNTSLGIPYYDVTGTAATGDNVRIY